MNLTGAELTQSITAFGTEVLRRALYRGAISLGLIAACDGW